MVVSLPSHIKNLPQAEFQKADSQNKEKSASLSSQDRLESVVSMVSKDALSLDKATAMDRMERLEKTVEQLLKQESLHPDVPTEQNVVSSQRFKVSNGFWRSIPVIASTYAASLGLGAVFYSAASYGLGWSSGIPYIDYAGQAGRLLGLPLGFKYIGSRFLKVVPKEPDTMPVAKKQKAAKPTRVKAQDSQDAVPLEKPKTYTKWQKLVLFLGVCAGGRFLLPASYHASQSASSHASQCRGPVAEDLGRPQCIKISKLMSKLGIYQDLNKMGVVDVPVIKHQWRQWALLHHPDKVGKKGESAYVDAQATKEKFLEYLQNPKTAKWYHYEEYYKEQERRREKQKAQWDY